MSSTRDEISAESKKPSGTNRKIKDLILKKKIIDGFLDNIFYKTHVLNKTKLFLHVEEDLKSKEIIIDNFLENILDVAPMTTSAVSTTVTTSSSFFNTYLFLNDHNTSEEETLARSSSFQTRHPEPSADSSTSGKGDFVVTSTSRFVKVKG